MATLRPENVVKTVDSLGRVTLPKGLRDRLFLNGENNKLAIYTMEANGQIFICLATPDETASKGAITV